VLDKECTHWIRTRIQLIHKPLVPRIDTILEHIAHSLKQAFLATSLPAGQAQRHLPGEVLGLAGIDEGVADDPLLVGQQLTSGPGRDGLVGFPDEGDDEGFDGVDELVGVNDVVEKGGLK